MSSAKYRPDIDGLRAIAVLSVMVFHARESLLPGGFVGVDIFFVISGYLISKHIAEEALAGTFSFAEFYRRRIRRILPMMFVVVAATLAASLALMTPEDATAAAKSAVWSIASLANVHFWRDLDTGYFASSSAEVPLLHLWSLGVEEQFYMLWPIVLVLGVRRLRSRWLIGLTAVVAGASFWLAQRLFPTDPSFAYYMLPTRMGELMMGALASLWVTLAPTRLGLSARRLLGWGGLVLIVASLVMIDGRDAFPGWLALPPTLGAMLLIAAGESGPTPLPGLTSRPMLLIGKISYSAYLWHWPLFALYRYGYGEPSLAAGALIIVLTLALAGLSYRYVETPARHSSLALPQLAMRQFVLPALLIATPALLIAYASRLGLPLSGSQYREELAQVRELSRPAFTLPWVCQRQQLSAADVNDPRCVLGAGDATPLRALLWGDSNAAHYTAMVKELSTQAGIRFRNFAVGSCPPLLDKPARFVEARRESDCTRSVELVRQEIAKYPVLLISASWTSYIAKDAGFVDELQAMLQQLAANGHTLILIGKAPVFSTLDRRCREKALKVPFKACSDEPEHPSEQVVEANRRLRDLAATLPKTYFLDPTPYLCPAGLCGKTTDTGVPRYIDASHLSTAGSSELGQRVLSSEGYEMQLRRLLAPPP